MLKVIEQDFSLELIDKLCFDDDVRDVYDEIHYEVEQDYKYYHAEYQEERRDQMKKFLDHELTDADKIQILENIKKDYEGAVEKDYGVTLFDRDGIVYGIYKWIEDTFEL